MSSEQPAKKAKEGEEPQPSHQPSLSHSEMLKLKRWNSPSIYNGWEQITKHSNVDSTHIFNEEETRDFMPEMGVMVGYAVTVVIEPSNPAHKDANPNAWNDFRRYIASTMPGTPKIVVMQDLDKPRVVGSAWGEVGANISAALGCVGCIVDGAIRDVDEMKNAGFHALARRLCVGHANAFPVRWGCEVEVFGTKVSHGTLIHADKHGFMAIPKEDEAQLLEATIFMDHNENDTMIAAARAAKGKPMQQVIAETEASIVEFGKNCKSKFGRAGEFE